MIKPGEIPQFSGDLDSLSKAATKLTSCGPDIEDTGSGVHTTFQSISASYIAPEAWELLAATKPVQTRAESFGGDVGSVGGYLATYVEDMRPIATELSTLKTDAQDFVDRVEGDDDWQGDEDKVNEHNGLLTGVNDQVLKMMEVERTCANAIEALFGGRQWHAGDADDPDAYGPTDIPDNAETPWGTPEEYDAPWYEDAWNGAVSFVKGVVVDGLGGLVVGVLTLVPVLPLLGTFGVPGLPDWSDFGNAWKGLGLTVAAAAVWGSGLGTGLMIADQAGWLPDWASDSFGAVNDAGLNFLKGMVAWDMWSEDPARASGAAIFNIATIFVPGPKGLSGLKGGSLVDDAARAGSLADDAARAGGLTDDLARSGSLADDLARTGNAADGLASVDDIAKSLKEDLATPGLQGLDDVGSLADDLVPPADDVVPPGIADDGVPPGAGDDAVPPGTGDDAVPPGTGDDAVPPGAGDDAAKPGDDATKPGDDPVTPEEAARRHDLGWDPAVKKFRPAEAETALRIEETAGVTLERSPAAKGPDWVDSAGKTYDSVGNFPGKYFDKQWPNLQKQIVGHLDKADFVPIDVAKFTPEQVATIKAFIEDGNLGPRVFIVGE
ncbi:MAG: hypothetical protein GEV10_21640 [Streptosporangiales bacterium]|nr:hypothetical protein [Streptosporangiales bacterium]